MFKYFKKLFMTLILINLMILVLSAPVIADSGLITGNGVNVRSGPGLNYMAISSLNKDTRVEILEKSDDWYKIKADSLSGWVYASLIKIDEVDIRLKVIVDKANLRSGPGTSYSMSGQAAKDEVLTLVEVQGDWYKVKTSDGSVAFVRADLVDKMNQNENTSPAGTITSGSTPPATLNASTTKTAGNPPKVFLDDRRLSFEVDPFIDNNRILVPLRAIFEAMGATVTWQQENSTAVATKDDTTVVLPLNSIHPTINGKQQTLDTSAKVVQQRILAPLRFVGEAFGGEVTWDQENFTVKINSPAEEDPATPSTPVTLPGLKLSSARTSLGITLTMESDQPLECDREVDGNNLEYVFSGVQISGSDHLKEAAGSEYITAQATARGENVAVNVEIPAGYEYERSSENSGCREVLFIPNAVSAVKRNTFGDGGERLDISALCSFTYTSNQDGNQMEIDLNGLAAGKAQSTYKFDSSLISKITFTEKANQHTLVVVETTTPAKFALGLNSDRSGLYILFIDKNKIQSRVPMVVLDPGHGGKDTGACGYAIEKDANLAIALKAGEDLKQNGIQVVFTRSDDSFLELNEITDIANMYNAALFVSIHNNSSVSPTATGTETYYYAPVEKPDLFLQKDERCSLATIIQQHVVSAIGLPDRGVKQANFAVLRNSDMPSALVEGAFVSNPLEGTLLTQDSFRDQIGEAIAQAIIEYMRENVTS